MLIAQITDLHIGFVPNTPDEPNRQRLDQVLTTLIDGPNRPDLLMVTGDITDRGDEESYARLAAILARCPFPVYPCMGNHDDRRHFSRYFPQVAFRDGFVHYCIKLNGLRLIVLDTLEPGRHGGAFCPTRARWLRTQLDADRTTPTVIVMHHPPIDAGIAWMSGGADEPWVSRFRAAIAGHDQIRAIWCGHLHRPIAASWHGMTVTVCPASAAQLALDLRPIDPETPDDRPMIVADPPGYALHRWHDGQLVSLFDTAEPHGTLARFDANLQPLVRHLAEERGG
ncbi:MAG: phosphodiesterase [Sphingomonas sp. 28-62-20]|uniref:phosphodiesterase n=1 Tax=Sphingomonas sp. 28-62-20 TaxID=1970433 RepID=UPI000A48C8FF|nr:MAG: phosphodiesterase [Sphingomonas sp. 28-62-20]